MERCKIQNSLLSGRMESGIHLTMDIQVNWLIDLTVQELEISYVIPTMRLIQLAHSLEISMLSSLFMI